MISLQQKKLIIIIIIIKIFQAIYEVKVLVLIILKNDQLLTQPYALLKIIYIFSKHKILAFKFLWYKDKHV